MGKRGGMRSDIGKRFYNRETITALNYDMMQMSFIPPFPFMQLKSLTLFLIHLSQPIMIKWMDFKAMLMVISL